MHMVPSILSVLPHVPVPGRGALSRGGLALL